MRADPVGSPVKLEEENRNLRRILQEILQIDQDARNSNDSMSFEDGLEGRLLDRWRRISSQARAAVSKAPSLPS